MRLFILVSLLIAQTAFSAPNLVRTINVRPDLKTAEYTLPNGLTIVLSKNPQAPLVNVLHWVKAGSLNETPGITGIAHLFEHMMFRPVRSGEKDFFSRLKSLGGDANASTRFESTVFTSSVPAENLRQLLLLESDRFRHLRVTDDLLKIERQAVRSEYSTTDDSNPIFDLWATIYRVGFPGHPYGWMITGFREDLDKIKASDCNTFFSKYYLPNNVGLFISGNFDTQKALSWIENDYSSWKRGEDSQLPPLFKNREGYTFSKGKLPSEARNLLVGYRIPDDRYERYPLSVLASYIFFESEFSLIKRRLVLQKRLATPQVSGFNFDYDNGMIKALIPVNPGVDYSKVVSELEYLPDDFRRLGDREYQAYLVGYQTGISEELLRNEGFNYQLGMHWGKYGGIEKLKAAVAAPLVVVKRDLDEFVDAYFQRSNLVVVSSKE